MSPPRSCWFPNAHTCIHFSSPPSSVSGSAPEWKWINNTKVWLDVWDPASGFHFPDRAPGRCPFQLPSNFFQEKLEQSDAAPNTFKTLFFYVSWPRENREIILQVVFAQMLKVDGQIQHRTAVNGHSMCVWSRKLKLLSMRGVKISSDVTRY